MCKASRVSIRPAGLCSMSLCVHHHGVHASRPLGPGAYIRTLASRTHRVLEYGFLRHLWGPQRFVLMLRLDAVGIRSRTVLEEKAAM